MHSCTLLRAIALTSLLAFSAPALAVAFFCDGKIVSVGLNDGNGQLWISYGAIGIQQICSVAAVSNGIQPDTCRAWMSLLLSAQAQDRTVRLFYETTTSGNPTSCSGLQPWQSYYPYFVHTVD